VAERAPLLPGGRTRAELEASLEAYFFRQVRLVGGDPIKLPTTSGLPDRMVLFPGACIFFVELKIEKGGKVSTLQRVKHQKMRRLGHRVFVLHGREEVKDWLHQVISGMGPQPKRPGRPSSKPEEVSDEEEDLIGKLCTWCSHPVHSDTIECRATRSCDCTTQTL
jgi:hypothetical protein